MPQSRACAATRYTYYQYCVAGYQIKTLRVSYIDHKSDDEVEVLGSCFCQAKEKGREGDDNDVS